MRIGQVNLEEKLAKVLYNERCLLPQELSSYLEELGFKASLTSPEFTEVTFCRFHVEGMKCHSCVNKIESNCNGYSTLMGSYDDSVLLEDYLICDLYR